MEHTIDLLAEALKSHGMEIVEVLPPIIRGKWNNEDASIFLFNTVEGVPDTKDALFKFLDEPFHLRSVAALAPIEEPILLALEREGVLVWDRLLLEAIIGRHTLLIRTGMRLKDQLFPQVVEKPQALFLAPLDVKGEQTLVPKVSRAEAEHRASRVGGFEFQQMLVPHYLFRYRCTIQTTGGEDRERQGLVWVDSVSGEQREINISFTAVDELDIPHFKMEPEIELSDAMDLALEGIVVLNTKEDEEIRHTGTATIFEKQKTFPVQETIETEFVGLLYLPMWNIEGSRGTMTINAVTAEVVSEQSYHAKE